ncbi:hypothetical protein M422DRAFT_229684 [Sphaerobolus stellatus SS14]|uniref:Mitochondrial outer membrane transport complex Sam37/metaxin N-terminal domain-containing protein n=1 Tax=Sphaerobolus stellatus (strain SS14) TaxID=990650 RepID=A0A0C9VT16_SPHS4|nr:hypothetical protein M422DRAFT_229684 [Sphaerobolus stellatus SS14]
MPSKTPLVLHVWPGRWDLPSIDPVCLEAFIFLQISCPGHFVIMETTDPDVSPTGLLPFLTHGQHVVASVPSIISYVSGLNRDIFMKAQSDSPLNLHLDAGMPPKSLSQRPAWRAYIETKLGDLVAHSFWVLDPNYAFTYGTYASMLPVPQRYYVPRRIRESYKSRLEVAGLWSVASSPEIPEDNRFLRKKPLQEEKEKMKRAFGQAQLTEMAKPIFKILVSLSERKQFLSADRPTTIDIALASHILLLIHTPLPNQALKDLLRTSYPSLIAHALRIQNIAFSPELPLILEPPRANPLQLIQSTTKHLFRRVTTQELESDVEKEYRLYRWGWVALTIASVVGYSFLVGARFVVQTDGEAQEEEEEQEQAAVEEEEEEEEEEIEEEIEAEIDEHEDL